MREQFIDKVFYNKTIIVINAANKIITDYQAQGFTLTLRQLYYQFVARGLIPNNDREYNKLGSIINDARLAGLIDWNAIEDRTRFLRAPSHWEKPQDVLQSAAYSYRIDLWATQPYRVEVWIEKDALIGVIEGVCDEFRLPYYACRGYSSQSEQYRAGKRFDAYKQHVVIVHLGDHDPSGIDMTRDNDERLNMFARHGVEVRRIALNMDQVDQYNPPPNPTKLTDSRAAGYIDNFGDSSWELDALEPTVIADLIRDEIEPLIDTDAWNLALVKETAERGLLRDLTQRWPLVRRFLTEY